MTVMQSIGRTKISETISLAVSAKEIPTLNGSLFLCKGRKLREAQEDLGCFPRGEPVVRGECDDLV